MHAFAEEKGEGVDSRSDGSRDMEAHHNKSSQGWSLSMPEESIITLLLSITSTRPIADYSVRRQAV
jgi:hypothetical protein